MSEYENHELYLWVPEIDYDHEEWGIIFERCRFDINNKALDSEHMDDVIYDKYHRDPNYYKIATLETFIFQKIYKPYSQIERPAPKIILFFQKLIQYIERPEYSFYFSHLISDIKIELELFYSNQRQVYYNDDFFSKNSGDEFLHLVYQAAFDVGICLFERLNGYLITSETPSEKIKKIINTTPSALNNQELNSFNLNHAPNNLIEMKHLLLATLYQCSSLPFKISKQIRETHNNGVKRSYNLHFYTQSGQSEHYFSLLICQFSKSSEFYIRFDNYSIDLIHQFITTPAQREQFQDGDFSISGWKPSHITFQLHRFELKEFAVLYNPFKNKQPNLYSYTSSSVNDFSFIQYDLPKVLGIFENIENLQQLSEFYLYAHDVFIPEIEDIKMGIVNHKISSATVLEMYNATFIVEPVALELRNHLKSVYHSYNNFHPDSQDRVQQLLCDIIPSANAALKAYMDKE